MKKDTPKVLVINDNGLVETIGLSNSAVDVLLIDRDDDSKEPIIIKRIGIRKDRRLTKVPRTFTKTFRIKQNGEDDI